MRTVEVMINLRAFLNDPNNPRRLPRLRWYLLGWFATCTVLVVVAYTQLLDYYLELGIELRTQTLLENTSADLEARGIDQVELPRNLKVFKTLDDLPVEFQGLFDVDVLNLMRLVTYTNVNVDDERDFRLGSEILRMMGFKSVALMTNNPAKIARMEEAGIIVTERVPLKVGNNPLNQRYLDTKAAKSGHLL